MSAWSKDELRRIAESDDLHIPPFREDGKTKEVTFEPVNGEINRRIDNAYKMGDKGSPYLKPVTSSRARSATMKVSPRTVEE